ncbi:uridine kinase [Saccharomonospora sp. CUA-673]|uniref:uridine kinase n=1 Tax=Saccharomonospora sp. CUA-673 TaxID=1904969 RepID=UPI0009674352|nr:uridine kinase [Saccharomonospora sp. CUA-673]OLT43676.1 uridine kinase [Saccharomonospora sp. CUA-673]
MRFRPIAFDRLVDELTGRIAEQPRDRRIAVAIDGAGGAAGAADPAGLADALVDPLRVAGRAALRVSAWNFLRPSSLRFERGRHDPDTRYEDWLDVGALRREVLDPLRPGGSGEVLPALWDAAADRAYRRARVPLPAGGVVLVDGELLLGQGLAFDLTVHLWLSPDALARRLPTEEHWALPAYARYERETTPAETADVVVRMDRPANPAVRE